MPNEYEVALRRFYDDKYECGIFDPQTGIYTFFNKGLPVAEFYLMQYGLQGIVCIDFIYENKLPADSGAKPKRTVRYVPKGTRM